MQTKNRNRGDKQQRFLLLFLFYIRQVFYAIGRKAATCLSIRQQVISKQLVAFLFISVLAFVNLAAVEARTVTIDLDQLKGGESFPDDGWFLSAGMDLYLQNAAEDIDTYIVKGGAKQYGMVINAQSKKCVFQGNVTLTGLTVQSRDFTIIIQNRVKIGDVKDSGGIALMRGFQLTIEGPGTLDVTTTVDYTPGIGGYCANKGKDASDCGTLIIKSGTVNVTGGPYGAGIGGGSSDILPVGVQSSRSIGADGGTVIIEGGTVNAVGNNGAAAIGGGYSKFGKAGKGGTVTISGGTVHAIAVGAGAAIGGGTSAASKSDKMYGGGVGAYTQTGGSVTVESVNGAGIGSAAYSTVSTYDGIIIHGGTVTAKATGYGAGIGGGWGAEASIVYIQKDENDQGPCDAVIKSSAYNGAAIGGGADCTKTYLICINAKSVDCSSVNGAGIGMGNNGNVTHAIYLYGGDIKAVSTNNYGVGDFKYRSSNTFNYPVILGSTSVSGYLNADISSENNYALGYFDCRNGTVKVRSGSKATDTGDSNRSAVAGGSFYSLKPNGTILFNENRSTKLYQVKVRAFGLSDNTFYPCTYKLKTVSTTEQIRTFYARPIDGYFYFWLDEATERGEMTINGVKEFVDVVNANNKNQAPTIVHKQKGATNYYYFSLKEALDASTESDVLTLKHDYPLPSGEKAVSTKNITFDMNGYTITDDGRGVLEINSGLLSLKNGVLNTPASFHPAIAMQGGFLKKMESDTYGVLNLPEVTLKKTSGNKVPVCWTKVSNSALGTATNFRQGTAVLTDNQRSFSSTSTYPYYFWLVKGTNDEFSMDATPMGGITKYYYAEVPANAKHGDELNLQTYKALIENASSGTLSRYKTVSGAFADAIDGQTVKLIDTYTASNEVIRLPQGSADMVFDLQGYSFSGDKTLDAANHRLTLSGSGKLEGTTTLGGLVYTEIDANNLGAIKMNGQQVYRTSVSNLPTQNSGRLTYLVGNSPTVCSAGTNTAKTTACLWLPAGQQSVTLSDVLPTTTEQFAEASLSVAANHSNTVAASPLLNISGGTITVTPTASGSANVTYGSKSYVSSFSGTSASKRIGIYGSVDRDSGKDHRLLIASGSETTYLSLRGIRVQTASDKPALEVNAPADIELVGDNRLKGSYSGSTTSPAVQVKSGGSLTWQNCTDGNGRLYADGGAIGANASPAIQVEASATMAVSGATLVARHGNGKAADAIEGGTQKILAGSVDALYKDGARPVNKSNNEVYKVSVTTGLTPDQPYTCTYKDCNPSPFMAMPDAAGKIYCWQPEQELSAEKTKVVLTHPVSFEKTEIEVVQVEQNDDNVAPIVLRMTDADGKRQSFGNLRDAFDAMEAGTEGAVNTYSLQLLTRIANLRTEQAVPAYTSVTLDLGSFEIAAQNGSDVSFDASANGAYLNITGKGNIKNTFRIKGDVFITGVVPLTDAVVELGGKAVFRTLVKDLPAAAGNSYAYSYGEQQNVPFYLHDAQACLWLPDYGRSEELRFTVSGTGGSSTEYTAGNITTVTQRTEAIPATPVGVVARVVYRNGAMNQAFNTLQEAFRAAATAWTSVSASLPAETTMTDKLKLVNVQLLTGVTVSGTLKAEGWFTLNLNGKNLTSASGAKLQVTNGAHLAVADVTTGIKGNMAVDIDLAGSARLFVPGAVRLEGNVTKGGVADVFYWRTLVNMNYQSSTIDKVTFDAVEYPVIDREVCLWLPASTDDTKVYSFGVGDKTEQVSGYQVSAGKHDNDMTIGGNNNVARIGTQEHATLKAAFDAATTGQTVELMKTTSLEADYSLSGKSIVFELGKYELTGSHPLTVASGASLVIKSKSGSGKIGSPLSIQAGGTVYIGQDIPGDAIGTVSEGGNPRYRLLVTNLPANIPSGTHSFTFAEIGSDGNPTGAQQAGSFVVRENVGCLWLEEQVARRLTMTVGGTDYPTDNVTVNADHFNIETYGVSDVAQIRNGKKYRDLAAAFADASGKTIVLLKNAALKQNVEVNGSVVLETGSYTVTSQDVGSLKAVISVPEAANLQITGKGTIGSNFTIDKAGRTDVNSNGNLQADRTVSLTGTVSLNDKQLQRVSVEGLPAAVKATYEYNGQEGEATTSSDGSLCLWMEVQKSSPSNFFVEASGTTYMATSVLVMATHVNPVTVTPVTAVAAIGDKTYDTLADAFDELADGAMVNLRKSQAELAGAHRLPDALTGSATLDLGGNAITAVNASFDANNGRLVMANGVLGGTVALTQNVYAEGSVIMNNAQVSLDGKTVWRTFLTLPDGTTAFTFKLGDGTAVSSDNIRQADGHPVACLWLPSSNVARTLTVTAGDVEYALNNVVVASTHGNELDVTAGNDPVAEVDTKTFASLASALASVAEGGTVTLKKNLSLSSVQDIKKNLTLNLGGLSFTSGNSGFNVDAGKTLKIVGGMLLGTLRLQGEGTVSAGSDVKIAGIVLNKENKEVYRTLIKRGPSDAGLPGCYWLEATGADYDLTLPTVVVPGETWETTVPGTLGNHHTTLTAYKRIEIASGTQSWNESYQQTNLVLASGAVLDLKGVTGTFSLHRLTLHDGAKVTTANSGLVVAEEGIRYIRTFTGIDRWESVALPFTADRIMTEEADADAPGGKRITPLLPATGTGTAGNFWLKTMNAGGTLQNVSTTEMTANVSYLMAVPSQLQDKAIMFVSGPNQLLRRDKVTAVKPASGFASYANGTLDELTVNEYCYVLNDAGDAYERKTTAVILPFRGYLLADANTTTIKPQLRIGVITDAVVPATQEQLRIHTLPGRVVIESLREEQIRIYTFDGRLLRALRIPTGYTEIGLPRGLYIINRQKIIINQ